MRAGGKQLRGSQLREVILTGVEVRESSGTPGMEHTLLQALTTNLHHLSILSLAGLKLTANQAAMFGKVLILSFYFISIVFIHSYLIFAVVYHFIKSQLSK